ncbi:MAG: hypothetical protein M1814_004947 [Vezdaea aestivalis]|nr:MAG: hypothetical protein M1814_004947 [Vezdaea aestivalis]
MGDPLSALSGTVTLILATTSLINQIRRLRRIFRDAEDDYLALLKEVEDFNFVLTGIRDANFSTQDGSAHGTSGFSDDLWDKIANEVGQVMALLIEMRVCLDLMSKGIEDGENKRVDRVAWLRGTKALGKKRRQLEEFRTRIHFNLDISTAIESNLRNLSADLFQRQDQAEIMLNKLVSYMATPNAAHRFLHHEASTLGVESNIIHRSSGTDEDDMSMVQTSSLGLKNFSELVYRGDANDNLAIDDTMATSLATQRTSAVTQISMELRRCNPRAGICSCICHKHRTAQTPYILRDLIGNLLIGYSGMFLLKEKCNVRTCSGSHAKSIRLNYQFPWWFVAWTIQMTWHTCAWGPELNLMVQKRLPEFEENSVFLLAKAGNYEGVKYLLTNREIMPNDATDKRGHTPLHFAVQILNIPICRLLLVSGANPNLEMDGRLSAIQMAWSKILLNPGNQSVQQLRTVFPEGRCLEGLEFSDLHKVVLGLLPLDLRKIIGKPKIRLQVDCADAWGRTPLHWAALKANSANVKTLIVAGADVTVMDHKKETPIFKAVYSGSVECVSLLLAAKANVHVKNVYGIELMQRACQKSIQLVDLLVRAGASLESHSGIRALDYAVQANRVEVTHYLLRLGIPKNVPDWQGNTPVFAAIVRHAHETLELLLHEGVDLSHRNDTGGTVLHCVARFGVCRTAEIMSAVKLKGLDPFTQDLKGRGPREVLQDRIVFPKNLDSALDQLMTKLEGEYWNDNTDSESEDFFDALEMVDVLADEIEN